MKFNKAFIIAFTALVLDIFVTGLFTALAMHLLLIENNPDGLNHTVEDVLFGTGFLVLLSPAYLLAAPILGYCSDIFGRKRVLVLCSICDIAGYCLALSGLLVNNIVVILAGLALLGIGNSNLTLTLALIADVCINKTKALFFGIAAIAMNTVPIIMYAGNQMLAHFSYNTHSYRWLLVGIILLEVINFLILSKALPETNCKMNRQVNFSIDDAFKALTLLLSKPSLWILAIVLLLIEFASGLYNQYLFTYLTSVLNSTTQTATLFVNYRTCVMLLSLVVLYPLLIYKFSLKHLLVGYISFACLGLLIAWLSPFMLAQALSELLIASSFAMLEPLLWTLLSNCASRLHQGLALGLFGPIWMLSWMVSGILSDASFIQIDSMPLWLAVCVLLLVMLIIYLQIFKRQDKAYSQCI